MQLLVGYCCGLLVADCFSLVWFRGVLFLRILLLVCVGWVMLVLVCVDLLVAILFCAYDLVLGMLVLGCFGLVLLLVALCLLLVLGGELCDCYDCLRFISRLL